MMQTDVLDVLKSLDALLSPSGHFETVALNYPNIARLRRLLELTLLKERNSSESQLKPEQGKEQGLDDLERLEGMTIAMAQCELQRAIDASGLQESVLAKKLGKSGSFIRRILRGDHNLTVRTMARVFGVCGFEVRFKRVGLGAHTSNSIEGMKELGAGAKITPASAAKLISTCLEKYETHRKPMAKEGTFSQFVLKELGPSEFAVKFMAKFGQDSWNELVIKTLLKTGRYWRDGDAILPI